MMHRREFCRAAVGVALFTRVPRVCAAPYDMLITGGRVIDPSLGLDAIRDVAIANGRIVAVEPTIAAEAAEMIDARGKLVVPGLIDIHTHAARAKEEPPLCLADGVTEFVDAGSAGADRIEDVVAVAQAAPNLGRVLINIARTGVIPGGELLDLSRADVALARGPLRAIATSSSASRHGSRPMWPARTISKRSGGRRRRPRPFTCR